MLNALNTLHSHAQRYKKLVCIACGVFFTLGFAPVFLWPLAILALAYVYKTLSTCTIKQSFWLSFLFAFSHNLTALYWLPRAFYVKYNSWPLAIMYGSLPLLLICAFLSVFIALCFTCTHYSKNYAPKHAVPILFAFFWLVFEILRGLIFPWNLTGYIFANNVYMMQFAAALGVWGLSFVAVLAAALFAHHKKSMFIACMLVAWIFFIGAYRLHHPNGIEETVTEHISIRLVQPNIQQHHKWKDNLRAQHVQTHIELSQNATEDVIIWPETAVPYILEETPELKQKITNTLKPHQTLVTGTIRYNITPVGYYNSLAALKKDGQIVYFYDKNILVPFGEFIPLRRFIPDFISKLTAGSVDYLPGEKPQPLKLAHNIVALPLICYEAIFPRHVAKHAQNSNVLLNITNDAWYDGTSAPYQHYAMARMRAVENGLPLIRVANTGITIFVDKFGREIERLNIRQKDVLNIDFHKKSKNSVIFQHIFK